MPPFFTSPVGIALLALLAVLLGAGVVALVLFRRKQQALELKIARSIAKYKNHPVTVSTANAFAERWIQEVREASRSERRREVHSNLELYAGISEDKRAFCGRVYCHSVGDYECITEFSRTTELRPPADREQMIAYIRAVTWHVLIFFRERYTKDETGTEYDIDAVETITRADAFNDRHEIRVNFVYKAPNANYVPQPRRAKR